MAIILGNSSLTFLSNSGSKSSNFVHGDSIYRKPITGILFNSVLLKKSSIFDKRLDKYRAAMSDVANGEVKIGSKEISSIEKELNFSPTFSDYVKIMESVKVDRSNILDGSYENGSSKRNKKPTNLKKPSFKIKGGNYKEKERAKSIKETNGGRGQVEGLLEKKNSKMSKKLQIEKFGSNFDEMYERKNDSFGKIGGTVGEKVKNKNANEKFEIKKVFEIHQEEMSCQKKDTKFEKLETVVMRRKTKEKYDEVVRREHGTVVNDKKNFRIEPMDTEKYKKLKEGYKICQIRERSDHKNGTKFERFGAVEAHEKTKEKGGEIVGRGVSCTDIDERAAFKTFEVFTDVRNRPRVLRMEMEERIKNLANR